MADTPDCILAKLFFLFVFVRMFRRGDLLFLNWMRFLVFHIARKMAGLIRLAIRVLAPISLCVASVPTPKQIAAVSAPRVQHAMDVFVGASPGFSCVALWQSPPMRNPAKVEMQIDRAGDIPLVGLFFGCHVVRGGFPFFGSLITLLSISMLGTFTSGPKMVFASILAFPTWITLIFFSIFDFFPGV